MRFWKHALAVLAVTFVIAACGTTSDDLANAQIGPSDAPDDFAHGVTWDGRGTDSERCDYVGQQGRPASGWIHWVYATKGDSTDARLVLGGTGEGTYEPGPPAEAAIWHVYTPFFELDGLTADIYFDSEPGVGGGLVISDFCQGVKQDEEMLVVTKDVTTSFTRTHDWSVEKGVDPGKLYLHEDGSGDHSVTWTVDVGYEGFEDSGWNVSGSITIENTGDVDATITDIEDVLAGTPIDVDCGVEAFPTTLPAGETLTCSYDEDADAAIEGSNVVTVTSEDDTSYGHEEPIVWGDPTTELHASVRVDDVSDLGGEATLGTVTAPDGGVFTYSENVAWSDYGSDACDSERSYDNMASLTGDDDEVLGTADATLVVKIRCGEPETDVLKVSKTADATYQRTHEWDVDKQIDKEHLTLVEDGSGDDTVTWTIDVDYLGAADTAYTIFGEIEIENVSEWTSRTIETVTDNLGVSGVAPFAVDCELAGSAVSLPYPLGPGDVLTCAYSRDVSGYVEADDSGTNTATIVARGEDDPLTATDDWVFHASETNATVYLWDYSDLSYEWAYLAEFHAPEGGTFTYTHDFAWTDYDYGDKVKCGERSYYNWAKLFADQTPASFAWDQALDVAVASVTVDVMCDVPTDDTDKDETCDCGTDDKAL